MKMTLVCVTSALALTCATLPAFAQSGEVNIYSYREQSLLQPLIDQFAEIREAWRHHEEA